MTERLLTLQEAAERTRMSISWLRQRIASGEIPRCRIGRRVFISARVIESLLWEAGATTADDEFRVPDAGQRPHRNDQ